MGFGIAIGIAIAIGFSSFVVRRSHAGHFAIRYSLSLYTHAIDRSTRAAFRFTGAIDRVTGGRAGPFFTTRGGIITDRAFTEGTRGLIEATFRKIGGNLLVIVATLPVIEGTRASAEAYRG